MNARERANLREIIADSFANDAAYRREWERYMRENRGTNAEYDRNKGTIDARYGDGAILTPVPDKCAFCKRDAERVTTVNGSARKVCEGHAAMARRMRAGVAA